MNILVTGGAGFLGSHICEALSNAGHNVTVFDRIPSPYLLPNQTMQIGNLLNQEALDRAVNGQDIVYHFAGIADIDICANHPIDVVNVNIGGTVRLLEACRKANVKRFIFASSAYVFSDSGLFYRTSKQACEAFIEDYAPCYGLAYTILRYGSLYGPRADSHNSIHRILTEAVETGHITYYGDGQERREYIHVRDAAESSVHILSPEFENQHIMLTGIECFYYSELLEMIKEIMKGDVELTVLPRKRSAHYKMTPYSFTPRPGRKLVNNPYVDFGQGILECLQEIYTSRLKQATNEGRTT